MSPSTVPAAARPPPLPVAATARPAPPTHTRPLGLPPGGALGLRRRRRQRPARRRLHFPSFVSALETGSWLDRSPGRGPPSATPEAGSLSRQAISVPRLPRPLFSGVPTLPPRAQPGLRAVWVSGPGQRLSGCPSSSPPGPWNLPGCPARLLGGRCQSARRRRWSPSPPSGAGGAAASRGTPELPRAPSARLAELLAPRRRLSGRGDARSPPPPGPAAPLT